MYSSYKHTVQNSTDTGFLSGKQMEGVGLALLLLYSFNIVISELNYDPIQNFHITVSGNTGTTAA